MAGAGHCGLRLLPLWTLALPPCPGALGVEPALVTALSSWPSHLCLFRPMPVPSELWGCFANSTAPCYLESGLRGRSGGGSPFRGLVAHLLWDCLETIYRPLFPGPAPTRAVPGITVVDIAGVAGPGADLAARGQAGPMGPLCRRPAGRPLLPFSQGPPDSALKAGQVGQRCQSRPATRWPGDPSSPRCEPRTERPGFLCRWSLRRGFWGLPRMALGPSSSRTQADFPCTQTDCRDRGRGAWPDHRVSWLIGLSHVPHRQSWPSPAVWAALEPGRPRSLGSSVASALPAETTFGELSSLTSAWPRAARVPCAQPLPLERLRGGRGPSPAEGGRIPGTRPSGGSSASFCNLNGLLIF